MQRCISQAGSDRKARPCRHVAIRPYVTDLSPSSPLPLRESGIADTIGTTLHRGPAEPVVLGPNQPERFYRGGPTIAAFRGLEAEGSHRPEDWVGSTTSLFGQSEVGLSRLPSGELLRDAIRENPEAWLGAEHVKRFGADPAILVKLLDAGQRLPVHAHPDRDFARRFLGSSYGKTEAWRILAVQKDAHVHLGFRRAIDSATLVGWVTTQDSDAMLESMNRLSVKAGDTLFVPAGLPHAIDEGVFLLEVQEPTDFSVLMEWSGFALDGKQDGHLGLGFDSALECIDLRAYRSSELAQLYGTDDGLSSVENLLPTESRAFFRLDVLRPRSHVSIEESFAIIAVTAGDGALVSKRGAAIPLKRGRTILIPFAAGELKIEGSVEVIRCRPPIVA